MAKTATISATPRSELGSRANKRLRGTGKLPGVIYGHKEAVISVTLPKKELVNYIDKGAHLFDLSLDGKSEKVLIKDVQYDHLGIEVLHVDFARVSLDEKVKVTVPLELKGTPKGESEGGVLQQIITEIELECLVTDIPDAIRHNVSEMGMDSVLHIRELTLPANMRVMQDAELIVATVKEVQELVTPAAEAGGAEPEVITKGKAEEEAAAEAAKAEKK
jgi:large subunit ribosomal protein L25